MNETAQMPAVDLVLERYIVRERQLELEAACIRARIEEVREMREQHTAKQRSGRRKQLFPVAVAAGDEPPPDAA